MKIKSYPFIKNKVIKNYPNLILIVVLFFASFLRLVYPALVLFDGDESRDLFRTMNLVEKGVFPGLGAELITGGNLGPLEYYILAIPYLISSNPIFITSFVAVLNILAVVMLFIFCRDFFNIRTALIALVLYAFSPPAIIYSRKIWNPYFLPLFTMVFFYAVFKINIQRKKRYILAAIPAYACMLQFHASSIFLLPFLLLLISKDLFKKDLIRYTTTGFIISLILFSPMLIFEFSHRFSNTKNIIFRTGARLYDYKDSIIDKVKRYYIVAESNINNIPDKSYENQCFQKTYKSNMLNKLEVLLFWAAIIYFARNIFTKHKSKQFSYLLAWYFIPLISFFFLASFISNHYIIVQYPVQFIMIAVVLDKALSLCLNLDRYKAPFSVMVTIYIITLSASQMKDVFNYYNSADESGIINCYGFNIALKYKLEIVDAIIKDSNNNQYVINNNVHGCEDIAGIGGYNKLVGGYKYLFEVQKRKHKVTNKQTNTTYVFLLDLNQKVPVKKENRVNHVISWHKFAATQKFQKWKNKNNLNCTPINKQIELIKKDISAYTKRYSAT